MSKIEARVPPLLVMAILAFLMWLLSALPPETPFSRQFTLIVAATLLGVGLLLFVLAGAFFARAGTTVNPTTPDASSSLVTSGIYRITRNPMYVGCLLILIAWGLLLSSLISLVSTIAFVLYMNRFQIQPEERALEKIFGEEYLAYKNRVRRWL